MTGLPPCGTVQAYWRHRSAKQPVDEACMAANRVYNREVMLRRRRRMHQDRRIWAAIAVAQEILDGQPPCGLGRLACSTVPHVFVGWTYCRECFGWRDDPRHT